MIRKNIHATKWYHCKTKDNPADIITRYNSCDLNENRIWWNGPEFLSLAETKTESMNRMNEQSNCSSMPDETTINRTMSVNDELMIWG